MNTDLQRELRLKRQIKTITKNRPRRKMSFMKKGQVITANYLSELSRACNDLNPGVGLPKQVIFQGLSTGIILCDAASYRNIDFSDDFRDKDIEYLDGVSINEGSTYFLLIAGQDTKRENGLWSYNYSRAIGKRWQREAFLDDSLSNILFVVVRGDIYHGSLWLYYGSEDYIRPFSMQFPIKVTLGSYEDEPMAGTDLICEQEISTGDLIYVKDRGVFCVEGGDWKQITSVDSYGASESKNKYLYHNPVRITALTDMEDDETCGLKYYETTVSPPELIQKPPEE